MVNKGLFTDHATDRVHHAINGRLAFPAPLSIVFIHNTPARVSLSALEKLCQTKIALMVFLRN